MYKNFYKIYVIMMIFLSVFIVGCNSKNEKNEIFIPDGNLVAPRDDLTATLMPNGKVLIIGGVIESLPSKLSNNISQTAETYDPKTKKSQLIANMKEKITLHKAVLLKNGNVLIIGGVNGSHKFARSEIYDPVSNKFRYTGSMNYKRINHTTTLLPNGKVLVTGGVCNGVKHFECEKSAEIYDPVTGKFKLIERMNSARAYQTATLLKNDKVLIIGGARRGVTDNLSSIELYDPKTGKFSLAGKLNNERFDHTSVLLKNGKVLIIGGFQQINPYFRSAELFDPETGKSCKIGLKLCSKKDPTHCAFIEGMQNINMLKRMRWY